VIDYL